VTYSQLSTYELAQSLVTRLTQTGLTIAAAESLTGGLVCSALVDVPGASAVLRGSVTAYTTELKAQVLGVDAARLASVGPVDAQVAQEMADGAAQLLGADVAVATTGVAGPGPADGHEAGTVYIAAIAPWGSVWRLLQLEGQRSQIRAQTVRHVLVLALELLDQA
jgi:competence/damage-inducible protein cinA C-terminal domain